MVIYNIKKFVLDKEIRQGSRKLDDLGSSSYTPLQYVAEAHILLIVSLLWHSGSSLILDVGIFLRKTVKSSVFDSSSDSCRGKLWGRSAAL